MPEYLVKDRISMAASCSCTLKELLQMKGSSRITITWRSPHEAKAHARD